MLNKREVLRKLAPVIAKQQRRVDKAQKLVSDPPFWFDPADRREAREALRFEQTDLVGFVKLRGLVREGKWIHAADVLDVDLVDTDLRERMPSRVVDTIYKRSRKAEGREVL